MTNREHFHFFFQKNFLSESPIRWLTFQERSASNEKEEKMKRNKKIRENKRIEETKKEEKT